MRIGTQNLGMDEMERAATLVAAIMQRHALDVFALQEVYRHPKQGGADLVAILRGSVAAATHGAPMHYHEGPGDTWMINLTLSRYPLRRTHTIRIEERHLLHSVISAPEGDVHLFNFHAKRDGGGQSHACRYIGQALAYIAAQTHAGTAAYLVGDLNAPADRVLACGGAGVLRRNPAHYPHADFWAVEGAARVLSVEERGNEFAIRDAHMLTVAEVAAARTHTIFLPLVEG